MEGEVATRGAERERKTSTTGETAASDKQGSDRHDNNHIPTPCSSSEEEEEEEKKE